ncbi:MAG TPA: hypothetical protein VLT13_09330, partial [Bacteroidota bacterium]|nr:hypothetical protein [Bacteroidota bacterium]
DLLGREVAVLVNERKVPGNYSIEWNAGNLASGQYFCRMTVGDPSQSSSQGFVQTRVLLLLK